MSEIAPEPEPFESSDAPAEKQTNVWLIVAIVAIVLIVLCCCCAGLLGLGYMASEGNVSAVLPLLAAL